MHGEVVQQKLPSAEERRRIMEEAGTVLAQARALLDRLDEQEEALPWVYERNGDVGRVTKVAESSYAR